ncbi:MAG: hypothetical protein ACIAS6_06760 [Phycisphaerales bacterium JB060]
MGLGLDTHARKTRCPRCGYDLAGLGQLAPCPECGTDALGREELRDRRQRRLAFLHSYWALAILSALPLLPLLINAIAATLWQNAWPWQPGYQAHVESNDFLLLDVSAGLTILGFLGSVVLWPFLVLLLAYTLWSRWCDRHHRATPWWLWLLMPGPILLPFAMWWAIGWLLVFPD